MKKYVLNIAVIGDRFARWNPGACGHLLLNLGCVLTARRHKRDKTARRQECAASFASNCGVVRPGALHQIKNAVSSWSLFLLWIPYYLVSSLQWTHVDLWLCPTCAEHMYQGIKE